MCVAAFRFLDARRDDDRHILTVARTGWLEEEVQIARPTHSRMPPLRMRPCGLFRKDYESYREKAIR